MADGAKRQIQSKRRGRFGRHVWHDPRNRDYPAVGDVQAGALVGADAPIQTHTWWREGCFDQRGENCTIEAASGLLYSSPFRTHLTPRHLVDVDTEDKRLALYEASKDYDPWPGRDYDGTSSDAPLKLFRAKGWIAEWRWCFGVDDVLRTVSNVSPVTIGVNWLAGMEKLDEHGFVHATGEVVGGHEIVVEGLNATHEYVTLVQSWGPPCRWRLSFADLDALLKDEGDAVTIVLAPPAAPSL